MTARLVIWIGLVCALVLTGAVLLWAPPEATWHAIMHRVEDWGPWVGVALIGLMILHNVIPIPAELIAITAGATLGLGPGIAVIWLGAMLGAASAFWVARRFGRRVLKGDRTAASLARFDRFVSEGNWQGLLVVRLIPIVSFNLVNYAAGLSGVRWGQFLWTTALGIVPITALSVAAGAGLTVIGAVPALAAIAGIAVLGLLVRWYLTR